MRSSGQPASANNRRCVATSCDRTVDTRPYPTSSPSGITPTAPARRAPERPTPEPARPSRAAGYPAGSPRPRTAPTAASGPARPDPQAARPPASPTMPPHAPAPTRRPATPNSGPASAASQRRLRFREPTLTHRRHPQRPEPRRVRRIHRRIVREFDVVQVIPGQAPAATPDTTRTVEVRCLVLRHRRLVGLVCQVRRAVRLRRIERREDSGPPRRRLVRVVPDVARPTARTERPRRVVLVDLLVDADVVSAHRSFLFGSARATGMEREDAGFGPGSGIDPGPKF